MRGKVSLLRPVVSLGIASALAAAGALLLPGCPAGPRCGNAQLEAGEACDDGNNQSGDGCSATCTTEGGMCGDGVMDMGEECDDGAGNSNVASDACRVSCELPGCGDGVVDVMLGEECDPPGASCGATCMQTLCGNAIQNPGEGCDDGNTMDGDGCDSMCQPEPFVCPAPTVITCGVAVMGTLAAGGTVDNYCMGMFTGEDAAEQVFQFDAGVTEDVVFQVTMLAGDLDIYVSDSCDPEACVAASLNGGTDDEAALTAVTMGDSYFIFVDGYMGGLGMFTLRAGCTSTAVCGDGFLDGGEACDDGNMVDLDGCSATCQVEIDVGMCTGDTPPGVTTLVAGVDTVVDMGDVSASTDVANISCNNAGVGCSGSGPEVVAEVVMPMGTTDLTMDFDHTGGDELYAVTAGDMTVCVELECFDPFPDKTGTHTFVGISDGLADTTIFLLAEACDAMGASGVATSVTLTAN